MKSLAWQLKLNRGFLWFYLCNFFFRFFPNFILVAFQLLHLYSWNLYLFNILSLTVALIFHHSIYWFDHATSWKLCEYLWHIFRGPMQSTFAVRPRPCQSRIKVNKSIMPNSRNMRETVVQNTNLVKAVIRSHYDLEVNSVWGLIEVLYRMSSWGQSLMTSQASPCIHFTELEKNKHTRLCRTKLWGLHRCFLCVYSVCVKLHLSKEAVTPVWLLRVLWVVVVLWSFMLDKKFISQCIYTNKHNK